MIRKAAATKQTGLDVSASDVTWEDQPFRTITIQLQALGLISVERLDTVGGSNALFWSLTRKGQQLLTESRTVRSSQNSK